MGDFNDTKAKARRRLITDAQRAAQRKEQILDGFQCPHKRCMHVLTVKEFSEAPPEHVCPRCAASVEEFTPILVKMRKIKPPRPEEALGFDKEFKMPTKNE